MRYRPSFIFLLAQGTVTEDEDKGYEEEETKAKGEYGEQGANLFLAGSKDIIRT